MRKKSAWAAFLLAGICLVGSGMYAFAETNTSDSETELKNIRCAKDYEEVYKAFEKVRWNYYGNDFVVYDVEEEAAMMEGGTAKAVPASSAADTDTTDYSQVNTRDAQVDEADLIRTDGEYIYILSREGKLTIVSAAGKDSEVISSCICPFETVSLRGNLESDIWSTQAQEMFVDGDRLSILCGQGFSGYASFGGVEETWRYLDQSFEFTYDISDREDPALIGTYCQDGTYLQARKRDDVIYIFSQFSPYIGDSYENSDLQVYAGGASLPASSVVIPDTVTSQSYLVVSSLSTTEPSQMIDAKAFVSGADQFYASADSIYVMNTNRETYYESTELARLSYNGGQIEPVAAVRLKGYINDSFSIDEYEENVRVLTTYFGSTAGAVKNMISDLFGLDWYDDDYWTRHNALYVLDDHLNYISSIQGIAKNEEVRSARFFGDTAYFVTYENTDPLFAVDLSDPKDPVLLSELSITGFSTYLHPYGEGKLLGMGFESDPDTGKVLGVKLSMFDISDPGQVTEIDRTVIRGMVSCEAVQDYKLILADATKNIIGFFNDNRYFVYRWTAEKGFERIMIYDLFEDGFNRTEYQYNARIRGLYSGNELYVAGENFVTAFDMQNGFSKDVAVELT